MGVLEYDCSANSYHNTDDHTCEKDEQEEADGFEQAQYCQIPSSSSFFVSLCSFEEHNGNRIVQDRFAKDDGVQLWLDFVEVEDGKNRDRVGS